MPQYLLSLNRLFRPAFHHSKLSYKNFQASFKGLILYNKIKANSIVILEVNDNQDCLASGLQPQASSLWIQWDQRMAMECSWGESVYYLACFPSDRWSVGALELPLHPTVCKSAGLQSALVSASAQSTGQSSLHSDSVNKSLLPTGAEAAA